MQHFVELVVAAVVVEIVALAAAEKFDSIEMSSAGVHLEGQQVHLASKIDPVVAAVDLLIAKPAHQSFLSAGASLAFFVAGQKLVEQLIVHCEVD